MGWEISDKRAMPMEEDGELAGDGHDGTSVPAATAATGEFEPPPAQIAVLGEGPESELCRPHEHPPKKAVTLLGDAELPVHIAGLCLKRCGSSMVSTNGPRMLSRSLGMVSRAASDRRWMGPNIIS